MSSSIVQRTMSEVMSKRFYMKLEAKKGNCRWEPRWPNRGDFSVRSYSGWLYQTTLSSTRVPSALLCRNAQCVPQGHGATTFTDQLDIHRLTVSLLFDCDHFFHSCFLCVFVNCMCMRMVSSRCMGGGGGFILGSMLKRACCFSFSFITPHYHNKFWIEKNQFETVWRQMWLVCS